MKKEEIFEYVQKQYGTLPEYLWSKTTGQCSTYRHEKMENGMQ